MLVNWSRFVKKLCISALMLLCLAQASWAAENNNDPLEGWNRSVHQFNEVMDDYIARPAAKTYRAVLPKFVRNGIGNFFSNLGEIPTAANDILQAKPGAALEASGRFLINSTLGVFGLFDVATLFGIDEHSEDFGQTLAVWGVGSGPYLVLPFLGPSTLRDTASIYPNYYLSPVRYADLSEAETYGVLLLEQLHRRHDLLDAESIVQGDRYRFFKDAYLQSREYEIKDGQVEDKFDAGLDDLLLD